MARSTIVRHETAVGAFTLVCAAILAAGLIVKGAKVGFGARHVTFTADAGHDLKKGATVKMQGIEVGEVEDVDLEQKGVHVHVKIYPEFREFVHRDAVATIDEPPILGSASVLLEPGAAGPLEEGEALTFKKTEGLMSKVQGAQGDVEKTLKRVDEIANRANDTLATVDRIVNRLDNGEGVAGRLIRDEKLAQDFTKGVSGVVALVDDVQAGKGVFALLKDEQLGPDIRQAVADVRSMTDAVAQGQGSLGRLMTNDTVVVRTEDVLKDVRGALARLDEITRDTTVTTKKVQDVLDSAKSTLDKLDGTIKNAEKVTGELASISEKVDKGPGTLSKLVNDDAIFRETKALLKEVRESVEDLREQTPINSFIGVVFSAF
jgi:phospholipid/cholesterol/gamma-HCH transport system substrate-binding protein